MGHGSEAIWNVPATGVVISWIPLMIFAFLYGISMDYEVFMITRIREAYDETHDTDQAISLGLARTGKLIPSGAGVLMFAFFALSTGPGLDIKLFGIGLAAGVIIDATLIRLLLLPSSMQLLGRGNWGLPLVESAPRARKRVPAGVDGEAAPHEPEPARAALGRTRTAHRPLRFGDAYSAGSPVSSHSRQTQSRPDAASALSAAGTIVTPQAGQMGGSSSTLEVWRRLRNTTDESRTLGTAPAHTRPGDLVLRARPRARARDRAGRRRHVRDERL